MEHRGMQWFRFDGTSIEEIHNWMNHGAGVEGVARAVQNLEEMAKDLKQSQDSLRAALEKIGVGWEGVAGDEAGSSVGQTETWSLAATPVVESSTDSTQSVGDGFAQTRNGMPTPQEAELTTLEHTVARSVPLVGPMVDRAWADAKRDQVTNEARQRMNEWQASANDAVERVQPLPPVPQAVVDVAPTQAAAAETVSATGSAGPVGSLPAASVPAQPGGQPPASGGSPVVPGPGRPPASPGLPPVSSGPPPAAGPGPVGQPPVGQPGQPPIGQPGRPPSGSGLMPVPIGGIGSGGTAPGRRRAFGPGMYSTEEITGAKGGAGTPGLKGAAEPGGAAGLKGAASGGQEAAAGRAAAKGMAGAVPEGGPAGARGSAAGRGGRGLMQPAVGAGGHGEDDGEHSDKYADKTDEHFTEGIQRVAPPVIGG